MELHRIKDITSKKAIIILSITCLLWVFIGSYAWPIMFIKNIAYQIVVVNGVLISCIVLGAIPLRNKTQNFRLLCFILVIGIWTGIAKNHLPSMVNTIGLLLPILMLNCLSLSQKKYCLNFVTKWYAVIIGVGFLIYLLLFVVKLSPLMMYDSGNDFYPLFGNYLFYLQSPRFLLFPRYNGPFLEPGHLAIISSFFLYANKFDFKHNKYLWILLVCIIASFSLAGWILTFIGYLFLNYDKSRALLLFGLLIVSSYYFFKEGYNDGDNSVNQLIIERLEYDDEKGIKGNNRFFGNTDTAYERAWKFGELWTGKGKLAASEGGAGYKIYFLTNGLISALLMLIFYISMIGPMTDKKYSILFLLLIIICFIQRAYPMWFSWLFPFFMGCNTTVGKKTKRV